MPRTPHILLMGQTPPPWHGQAVATQILFDHDWPDFEVHRLRMEFSEEMVEVGRFQWKKIRHLFRLIAKARRILKDNPDCVLFYPPASAKWIPFARDVVFLTCVRPLAGSTVFIFHASGLPVFVTGGWMRSLLGRMVYRHADISLEVAQEIVTPHEVFAAKAWQWCPCAIEVPELARLKRGENAPFTVLFVGSLQEGKGVLEILQTASILKNLGHENHFRFRLVGKWFSTEFEEQVKRRRAELELGKMIELVGQLTGDEKWQAYAQADAFFFPTHYASEATPIVLMEALGMGLPLVTTAWAGIPAMLDGCESAHILPIHSPDTYAQALLDLRCQSTTPTAWETISKQFYQQNFLPARFIERIEKAFLQASSERRGSGIESRGLSPRAHADDRPKQSIEEASSTFNDEPVAVTKTGALGESALPSANPQPSISSKIEHRREASEIQYLPSSSSPQITNNPITNPSSSSSSSSPPITNNPITNHSSSSSPISLSIYLADQNPGHDRSFGISRMSQVVLESLQTENRVRIETIASKTSQQAPESVKSTYILPWGTRQKWVRLLTDHFHPLFHGRDSTTDLYYFPKGYLPLIDAFCRPSLVTIHDTIIQYDEDHYPQWRNRWEYTYWAQMLKHTLRKADRIMTVSESSKRQIQEFMIRHQIPEKEITVTYEPCLYERLPQPSDPEKENYVIHLASCEPHKRTAHLIRWWSEAENQGKNLPMLHLIGTVPPEVSALLASSHSIVKRPFLEDSALQSAYQKARALILPSEIEGFGLPALEAYYLGTPVCFVEGTSVEEILGVATKLGRFSLNSIDSLFVALDEVMAMTPDEIHNCGLKLRETYAAEKVAERMVEVFHEVKNIPIR